MQLQKDISIISLILSFLMVSTLSAGETYWQVGSGNWSSFSNWTNGEPYSSNRAYINNGGTAQIIFPGETCQRLWLGGDLGTSGTVQMNAGNLTVIERENVGSNGQGRFEQNSGTHNIGLGYDPNTAGLYLGQHVDGNGVYELNNGLIEAQNEFVGFNGTGQFLHNDGNNLIQRDLFVGYNPGSNGLYIMWAVTSNLMGGFAVKCTTIGHYGNGVFEHHNGTHTVRGNLKIGAEYGSNGSYEFHDGNLSADSEYIGYSGTGTFIQYGGIHEVNSPEPNYGDLYIGYTPGGNGTYELRGGRLFAENEYIGYDGSGSGHFIHTGGDNLIEKDMYIGFKPGSHGAYIYDCAVTSNLMGGFAVKCTTIGYEGTGVFRHYGGTHIVRGALILGRETGSMGTYEITNDILQVEGNLEVGRSGTGILEITGGAIDIYTVSNDGTLKISDHGYVGLLGGNIHAQDLVIYPNGRMNIADGELRLWGDKTTAIEQYKNDGLITAYEGNGSLVVDYNDMNYETTVSAHCSFKMSDGDIYRDCIINFKDIAIIASNWLRTNDP